MPAYDYECRECGKQFEAFQPYEDKPLTKCPGCQHHALRRVLTSATVIFNGPGYYSTDNRK